MIKNVLTLFTLSLLVLNIYGQDLDGYKYVFIPSLTYQSGDTDIWGISSKLRTAFKSKGFVVLTESSHDVPLEIINNPCWVLVCYTNHTNITIGTNEVTISLSNCMAEVVHTNTGDGKEHSVQADYNIATKRAFRKIERMSYSFKPELTLEVDGFETEKTKQSEETLRNYFTNNRLNKIEGIYESYQSKSIPYYKIGIRRSNDNYYAIIIDSGLNIWQSGEVKAVFEPTAINDFFSVSWIPLYKYADWWNMNSGYTVDKAYAKMETEAILSIEFHDSQTDKKSIETFIKLYPPAERVISNNKVHKSFGSGFFFNFKWDYCNKCTCCRKCRKVNSEVNKRKWKL